MSLEAKGGAHPWVSMSAVEIKILKKFDRYMYSLWVTPHHSEAFTLASPLVLHNLGDRGRWFP